ncbi:putative membrane protein [Burkholderia thailandensis MSMB121]|uniref:lipopolysaccharide biosynthesis protein n=1 Tax=Burkholderia humptydooensis TaxID=430531 RepID=UPI0003280D69|nr:hypothetical protein [Burkholderia humptydooensis]AGK48262.1 putative membrane protein [Burkholderia thailandensis MSMB121]ATF36932.1 hypothetical protein CO709_29265 [Burkholderia thailandensis]KST74307.1 hypothetical protein WS76_09185 [Burkholderia humptydooensis]
MDSTAIHRIWQTMQAQGFAHVAQMAMRFVEVPLFLHYWGAARYGEWLVLFAIPAYFSIADLGFNSVAAHEMTMKTAQGKQEEALTIFQSVSLIVFGLSAILLLSITLLSHTLLSWMPRADEGVVGIAQSDVVFYLALYVIAHIQIGTLQTGFYSQGMYGRGILLFSTLQFVEFLFAAVTVALGGGLLQVSQVYAGAACLGYLAYWGITAHYLPWLRYGFSGFRWRTVVRLGRPAVAALMFPVGQAMNHQGMRLVVGFVAGPGAVTLFVASRMLTAIAVKLQDAVGQALEPEYARAHGKSDRATVQQLLLHGMQATTWLSVVTLGAMLVCGERFFPHWTGGQVAFNRILVLVLAASTIVNAVWSNVMKIAYAANRHTKIAVIFFLGYSAACIVALPLTTAAGPVGAALALLIAEVGIALCVVPIALRMAEIGLMTCIGAVGKPPIHQALDLVRRSTLRFAKKGGEQDV